MRFRIPALCALALVFVPATRPQAQPAAPGLPALQAEDPAAALLLARARHDLFSGDFAADVVCVRESFLGGTDTLRGTLEVRASSGERRLSLRGPGDSFEWWSRLQGREQWRREGLHGRPRRIPPHSLKKPSFAADVSYEDLARLPFGHLEGNRSARRSAGTDTSETLVMVPGAGLSVLYASLEATFGRNPAVLRSIAFAGGGGRPSKRMEITRYSAEAGGFFPAEIVFAGEDGLSSVRLQLARSRNDLARDKMEIPDASPRGGFAEPQWVPRDEALPSAAPATAR